MAPEDHLRTGDLAAALAALQDRVRAAPADAKLRIFLFQLLAVLGDWTRALAQLKIAAELDEAATMMARTYREAIICEVYRERVFAGEKAPLVFGEPEPWLALLIESQRLEGSGETSHSADLRGRAFEEAPAAPGLINGTPFEWIADSDMRLGPVLEVIVNGRYFWLPFAHVARLELDAPSDLRDVVWTAGMLTLGNGGELAALIPTRYPATISDGSNAEKLARATRWEALGGDLYAGIGQRTLATDAAEVPLLDLRSLTLDAAASGAPQSAGVADGA